MAAPGYAGGAKKRRSGDDGDDVLCGGVGWNDYKNGGNHVNGDTCAFGGTNVACESTPLVCPLPLYISC